MLWNSFLLIYNYIRYFCCRRNLDNSVCDLAYVDREGEEQNCFFMAPFSPYQQKVSNDDWLTAEPAKCFLSSFQISVTVEVRGETGSYLKQTVSLGHLERVGTDLHASISLLSDDILGYLLV